MNPAIQPWLQEQKEVICGQVLDSTANILLYESEVEGFYSTAVSAINGSIANQLYAVQTWANEQIGTDTSLASDWLLIIRLLKEHVFTSLKKSLSAELILEEWPIIDRIFTYAVIEVTKIASNVDNAMMLGHMVGLREQIEAVERNKTRFIQVAAHELKTPLTLLEGYANMMRSSVPEDETLMQMYLGGFDGGTQRLREIITDMVDVSMIDSGSIQIALQPVHLEKLIQKVARDCRREFFQRTVELVVEKFPLQETIYGDPERLMQAFDKVISNGLKYTPDGGVVTVRAELIRAPEHQDGEQGFIDVRVVDTGIGIDPKNLETIFNTFGGTGDVSLHSSGKTKFMGGGPGLGLPIAKGIVEAHGGHIWAESEGVDERNFPGSIFHIELPTSQPTAIAEVKA